MEDSVHSYRTVILQTWRYGTRNQLSFFWSLCETTTPGKESHLSVREFRTRFPGLELFTDEVQLLSEPYFQGVRGDERRFLVRDADMDFQEFRPILSELAGPTILPFGFRDGPGRFQEKGPDGKNLPLEDVGPMSGIRICRGYANLELTWYRDNPAEWRPFTSAVARLQSYLENVLDQYKS